MLFVDDIEYQDWNNCKQVTVRDSQTWKTMTLSKNDILRRLQSGVVYGAFIDGKNVVCKTVSLGIKPDAVELYGMFCDIKEYPSPICMYALRDYLVGLQIGSWINFNYKYDITRGEKESWMVDYMYATITVDKKDDTEHWRFYEHSLFPNLVGHIYTTDEMIKVLEMPIRRFKSLTCS